MKPRRLVIALSSFLTLPALAWSCGRSTTDKPGTGPETPEDDAGNSGGAEGAETGISLDAGQRVDDAEPEICNDVACPALPHPNDPRFRYREHCCTASAGCGTGSEHVFGSSCFERDQPGAPSSECPAVDIFLYLDPGSYVLVGDYFEGCCRPDGLCGADTSRTVGAGCLELSELGSALDEGMIEENQGKGLEPMPCAP